jgi:HAMP domain-containing protein
VYLRRRLAALGAALLLVVLIVAIASAVLLQYLVTSHLADDAARAARETAVHIAAGQRLSQPLAERGGVLLQVVSDKPDGRVVASSAPLTGHPPLSDRRPDPGDDRVDDRVCYGDGLVPECLIVVGYSVDSTAHGSVVVYGAVLEPWPLGGPLPLLEGGMAVICATVIVLVALTTWRAVGRTLRPVARIEAAMAEITASDLSRRMPVPDGGDEVARLARTLNATLDRLEQSVEQQHRFPRTPTCWRRCATACATPTGCSGSWRTCWPWPVWTPAPGPPVTCSTSAGWWRPSWPGTRRDSRWPRASSRACS